MKLKEKLALEWLSQDQTHDFENAYIAGFEAAKTLVMQHGYPINEDKVVGSIGEEECE